MNIALGAAALVPGLALGSFLNVVAARLPEGRSVVHPPSACMSCEKPIAPRDNVPVLSWLILRGRCRHCSTAIPWKYPAVELGTAALVAVCVAIFGLSWDAAVAVLFCAALVAVTVTDLERRIIPNKVVLPAAAVILVAQTILHPSLEWALAGVGAAGFLLVAAFAKPGGMGMGDVKLALLLGVMLGRVVPVALMLGMIAALVPSLVLFARYGSAARKMTIPFGPFLALGGLIGLFAGDRIVDWYLSVL